MNHVKGGGGILAQGGKLSPSRWFTANSARMTKSKESSVKRWGRREGERRSARASVEWGAIGSADALANIVTLLSFKGQLEGREKRAGKNLKKSSDEGGKKQCRSTFTQEIVKTKVAEEGRNHVKNVTEGYWRGREKSDLKGGQVFRRTERHTFRIQKTTRSKNN